MTSTQAPAPIDPRGPRTNQAVLSCALVIGFVLGAQWVAPLFAVVLFLGAAFGASYGPVLRFFQVVIKPRLSPPSELEDPRPPRFAASVGVVFLTAASAAFAAGASTFGWVLSLIVAGLAALAAISGICVGCEMYVLLVRLRGGVRVVTVDRSTGHGASARDIHHGGDTMIPAEFRDGAPVWLVFTTQYCAVCPRIVEEIRTKRPDDAVHILDVADHTALAASYRVRRAPTVLRADASGLVLSRLSGADAVLVELEALATTEILPA
ncbi:MAG: DUF4395 family protein [Actinobacteria bacterium]|uniref:Unannotated protein n=1 Tax=freshwater metagenome TaxID=449393 RepID=A0A6J5YHP1_9ZZZZ|nr:DUF4395 family protein [Actinomycetota bacterium]MTA77458.1 DUF4395 family protein [Actinomycetota bacterium]